MIIEDVGKKNEIIRYKIEGKSYAEIANIYNISRQRVQQIIRPDKETIMDLLKRADSKCERCSCKITKSAHIHHKGKVMGTYNSLVNLELLCRPCHRKRHGVICKYICNYCGKEFICTKLHSKLFCSKECHVNYYSIPVVCDNCGKMIKISRNDFMRKVKNPKLKGHYFCSRKCVALRKDLSFNNIKNKWRGGNPCKKWDYDYVWEKHLETGYGCSRLSRVINIPPGTISYILAIKKKLQK